MQEEKRDWAENKEQKNEEKDEKQPQVHEEKRDQTENKEQKNEEKEMKKQVEQARSNIEERQNTQSNGQETIEPKRNSTINGKKRKHAMLFDENDPKNDLCSSAKKNLRTPCEAAVQDRSAFPFPCASQCLYLRQSKKAIKMQKGPNDARNYQYYVNLLVCKELIGFNCKEVQWRDRSNKI